MDNAVVPVIQMHFPIPAETLARAIGKNWFWPAAHCAAWAAGATQLSSVIAPKTAAATVLPLIMSDVLSLPRSDARAYPDEGADSMA